MREHLVDVCIDISDVFNTKVRATPARVTPMKLVVDVDKWENPANALGPRLHTPMKQAEVQRQVNKMKPLGVIRDSQESYYSQVHLTPKPTPGEWRFCIDYRRLNEVTRSMGWPLPNIAKMLRRVGQRKSKFFVSSTLQRDITKHLWTKLLVNTQLLTQRLECMNGTEYLWALKEHLAIFNMFYNRKSSTG